LFLFASLRTKRSDNPPEKKVSDRIVPITHHAEQEKDGRKRKIESAYARRFGMKIGNKG